MGLTSATLSFKKYVANFASDFHAPNWLSFLSPPNQQARVDFLDPQANIASTQPGDVQGDPIYQTNSGDPLFDSDYVLVTADVTEVVKR